MPNKSNRRPIFLLAGMPRAGTAWCFEILSAITVASGGVDGRDIRTKYKLEKYLTPGNTVVRLLLPDLLVILYPWLRGESFAVKTHDSPKSYRYRIVSQWLLKLLMAAKVVIPIYIYRDPRDAVLSAYEFGKRKPDALGGSFFVKRVALQQREPAQPLACRDEKLAKGIAHGARGKRKRMALDYSAFSAARQAFLCFR